mmetsp:Transcript_56396/g.156154  ORF Transcript_56396/g.156154 Transcript_56396/m.156154 type:complete len:203 (+) Transcript_56396:154-762(+)
MGRPVRADIAAHPLQRRCCASARCRPALRSRHQRQCPPRTRRGRVSHRAAPVLARHAAPRTPAWARLTTLPRPFGHVWERRLPLAACGSCNCASAAPSACPCGQAWPGLSRSVDWSKIRREGQYASLLRHQVVCKALNHREHLFVHGGLEASIDHGRSIDLELRVLAGGAGRITATRRRSRDAAAAEGAQLGASLGVRDRSA